MAKILCSQYRGSGFDPWSGNQIPHAPTGRIHMLQLKILCTTAKVQHSQINKNNVFRKRNISSPMNSLNPCNCKSQKKKEKQTNIQ